VVPHMKKGARVALLRQKFAEKQEEWKRRNIIIRNLPLNIDEEKLRKLCQEFGVIESIKIPKVKNIRYENDTPVEEVTNKGIGLICFQTPVEAAKAISVLRTKTVEDKKLLVFPWKPREEIAKIVNMNRMKKIYAQMWDFGMMQNPMMMQNSMMRGRGQMPMQGGMNRGMPGFQRGRGQPRMPGQMGMPHQMNQMGMNNQMGMPQQMGMMPQGMPQNMPQNMPQMTQPLPQRPVPSNFNFAAYENSPPEIKKRMLGESMYPHVLTNSNQKIAGKITGMLLEMDNAELLGLLSNPVGLKGKVIEAIEVLRKAWENDTENLKLIDG